MDKIKSFFLLLSLFMGGVNAFASYMYGHLDGQYFKFDLSTYKAWFIAPTDGSSYSGKLNIGSGFFYERSYYLTVVGIDKNACKKATDLTSVKFPNEAVAVGDSAFYYCTSLASVTLNDKLEEIDDAVFFRCQALKTITFPSTLKKIGKYAFYFSGLSGEITIPSSTDSIGSSAFSTCTGIKKLNLSSENLSIGNDAFTNFYADTVNVQSLVNWVGYKFGNLDSNPIHYKKATLTLNNTEIKEADLSNPDITTIGKASFYGNKTLEKVTFGKNVESIEDEAFKDTPNLTTLVFLSKTPPSKGTDAFGSMKREQVTLYIPAGSKEAYSQIFYLNWFKDVIEVDEDISTVVETPHSDAAEFLINNRKIKFNQMSNIDIYDISGNCIYSGKSSDYEFTRGGIFIVNGKKILIK